MGGRRVGGLAAVFDSLSADLGGFFELVKPGAFTRSLGDAATDVLALHHHKPELILGRSSAGTLRLDINQRGLAFEIDLPDTNAGNDVLVGIVRGDLKGASFAFKVPNGGDRWTVQSGKRVRELLNVDLHDISITAQPAYPDTEVAKRALMSQHPWERTLANRFLETV
jgi:HK97 family phage prohead protease